MVQFKHITKINSKQLLELEALEQEIFKDGGLNRWTLPVIARYGFLFALSRSLKGERDVIGLASFITKKQTAFLIGLWIDEKYRRHGYGQALLTESISQLRQSGIAKVELTVEEKNKPALKLYNNVGFNVKGTLNSFYGPSQNRLLLKINLLQ